MQNPLCGNLPLTDLREPANRFARIGPQRAQRSKKFNLDRNFQSRSKFLISLENFNLDVSNSPQKIGPRWVARSKIHSAQLRDEDHQLYPASRQSARAKGCLCTLENFILARNLQSRSKSRIFVDLWALWGHLRFIRPVIFSCGSWGAVLWHPSMEGFFGASSGAT